MPLLDINNPEVIKFLVETYEKTDRLRRLWNTVHAKKLDEASSFHGKEKGYYESDVMKEAILLGISSVEADYKSGARNRRLKVSPDGVHIPRVSDLRRGHSIVDVGLGDPKEDPRLVKPDTDLTIEPVMRPIPPKQRKLLFKGKPDFGRKVYLETRCKSSTPEQRYYFAEACSWDYGWRLKDSYFKTLVPQYGRVWTLHREKSRVGPQPDPIHYKILERGPNRCLES